ncbi:hypothetical protein AB4144_43485, partial [Rhizobiaceae sp. 2RAB30]
MTAQAAPSPAEPGGWGKFLFGDLADGVLLRDAMRIDAPVLKPREARPPEQPLPIVVAAPAREARPPEQPLPNIVAGPPPSLPPREPLLPTVMAAPPAAVPTPLDTRQSAPVAVPEKRSRTEVTAPTFREAENASMLALRQDHNRIANEIETALSTGGTEARDAVTRGGEAVSQAGEDAGRAIIEAGSSGGE